MDYEINHDVSSFLDASIEKVLHTLVEAFILVSLVVYLFLGDFRSTVIPVLAVPVSLIGAFFFMLMFGLSINLITLFALVLAIGVVVDDAIVVVDCQQRGFSQSWCLLSFPLVRGTREFRTPMSRLQRRTLNTIIKKFVPATIFTA